MANVKNEAIQTKVVSLKAGENTSSQNNLEEGLKRLNSDIILCNSPINYIAADKIVELTNNPQHDQVVFILCTSGGNPDAAFRIARRLQDIYKNFILYVHGICKSAGSLIAIGSDQIVMSDLAEFGPLDVQVRDKEELGTFNSGLNVFEAISSVKQNSLDYYNDCFERLTAIGLSTKTCSNMAAILTNGFFNPIISQIDPLMIGELDRAIRIAVRYGQVLISKNRGNIESDKLFKMISYYPCHSFVIDRLQAMEIFKNVRKPNNDEECISLFLHDLIRYPKNNAIIDLLYPLNQASNEKEKQNEIQT